MHVCLKATGCALDNCDFVMIFYVGDLKIICFTCKYPKCCFPK